MPRPKKVVHEQTRQPRGRRPAATNPGIIAGFVGADGKPFVKKPGMHYVIVEKLDQRQGLPDREGEYVELGYRKACDGPRKAIYEKSEIAYRTDQKAIETEANNRLKARSRIGMEKSVTLESGAVAEYEETRNDLIVSELSGSELVSGIGSHD